METIQMNEKILIILLIFANLIFIGLGVISF